MEDKNGSSREMSSREPDEKPDTSQEFCVLCGKPTGIPKDRDIALRDCYVEGAGQLCRSCYFNVYGGTNVRGRQ